MATLTRVMLVLALASPLSSPQQPAYRGEVHVIPVYATVRKDGRLAVGLTRDEFRITVDGKLVPLTHFSNEPQAITVAIMLDTGMGPRLGRGIDAALRFIDRLERSDVATFGTYGARVAVSPHLTGEHSVLRRVVADEVWPDVSTTPPWTAIDRGMSALEGRSGRRVVLVFSGGAEGGSSAAVRSRAEREGVMVYGVLFEGTMLDRLHRGACPRDVFCSGANGQLYFRSAPPGTSLNPLAERTGGGHFTVADGDDLAASMAGLADELRHQYLLGFAPPHSDGRSHDIRVSATQKDLTVRARQSYVAAVER